VRPAGDVSVALMAAARVLAKGGGGTYIDLAQHACVSRAAAQQSVKNMARRGELLVVARKRTEGAAKPLHVYVPAVEVRQLSLVF